jgi:hypothetical protein
MGKNVSSFFKNNSELGCLLRNEQLDHERVLLVLRQTGIDPREGKS